MMRFPSSGSIVALIERPLEETIAGWWRGIEPASRRGFAAAILISVLAFGFEMTNLTLHHDDVLQIFIEDTILGYYLGRFGLGWLHYYTQNHYFMPFLQMTEGIVMMSTYGVLVARFWGVRKTADITLVASIISIFPYMAQIYQYNTSMAPYPAAHLLAALAVIVSTHATVMAVVASSILYVAAFSIYQSVAANAATILVIWLLGRLLFEGEGETVASRSMQTATATAVAAAVVGGVLYLAAVSTMHIEFDAYQSPEDAFQLRDAVNLRTALPAIWTGTRNFLLWPEGYFPDYLKALQLAFIAAATLACLVLPRRLSAKAIGVALAVLAVFMPRIMQSLHPEGHFASRTLTAYAVLIAGMVMIVQRTGLKPLKKLSTAAASVLIAGYILQCNWISTVNYLNTLAHFATLTQVLARVRAIPDPNWDGLTIAVAGTYAMPNEYPFKQNEAVASKFMDAKHMNMLARLTRDEVRFVAVDRTQPDLFAFAASHPQWPAAGSVGIVDGMGVVVFSKIDAQ